MLAEASALHVPQIIFRDDSPHGSPRFVLGFDGVTEFTFRGHRYAARHHPASRTMNRP